MATDLASLAIRIENSDVVKATTSLNSMAVAGGKTEAATQRLTRRMALLEIEALQMDSAIGKSSFSLTKMAASMGIGEAAAGKLTHALGALSVIGALGFIGHKTIEETELAQAAMAQLEAAVKSTGGAAGRSVQQLDALSIALQKTTTFSDEAVKGAEAILLTFNQIRGVEFDAATQAVTDLATRMGGDLQTAALQVGKALQDPATGLSALRRAGVSFSAAQIEVVKHLYETNRVAEGQRVILAELQKQFGGSAAAARDTLGGALTALKNAWGDLFEVSRKSSQGTVAAINEITGALEHSGLTMNKVLHDATHDWIVLSSAAQEANEIMSLPLGSGFFAKAKAISERIDFDLNSRLAAINNPDLAKPDTKPPPRTPFVDSDALKQAKKDLEELQKQTDAYYNSLNQHQIAAIKAAGNLRDQNAATREMIAATMEGPAAVEALTIAQAGANAVRELGIGVSDKVAAAVRREAEEQARLALVLGHVQDAQADAAREAQRQADEAQRKLERRAEELHRTISGTIEGIFTDIDQHRNPFVAIFDNLKRGAIHAISDILATKIEGKVADMLGIQIPATKQEKAAKEMNVAADKMLRAANAMNGGGPTNVAGITIEGQESRRAAIQRYVQQFLKVAGAGYAGYQTGYGIGQATGSGVLGAVGGAFAGAKLGGAIGGPPGAVVGALAGFAGGIIGAGDAAKEAAARLEEARREFKNTWDGIIADINGDELAKAILGAEDRFQDARQKYLNAHLDDFLHGNVDAFRKGYEDIATVQAEYIAQLREEAAAKTRSRIESYRERELRAQGKTAEADELGRKEERQALIDSFGKEIDASERQILAALDGAQAAERNTAAINGLTTAVHGGPSGFKLAGYIQQYATGAPYPTPPRSPAWPTLPGGLTPPGSPSFSQSGKVATAQVVLHNPIFQFPNITEGKAAAKAFLGELDKTVAATGGLNTTRAAALNKMSVS